VSVLHKIGKQSENRICDFSNQSFQDINISISPDQIPSSHLLPVTLNSNPTSQNPTSLIRPLPHPSIP